MNTEEVKEKLKISIERDREAIAQDIRHLERAVRGEVEKVFDWREWVRTCPVEAVLGALLLGVWIGRRF